MGKYNRRFSKEEYKQELAKHLLSMPKQYFASRKHIEEHAQKKAEYYDRALKALDEAIARVKRIAETHPEVTAREDADAALKKIDEAIGAYGDASMNQNQDWNNPFDIE